MIKLYKTTWLTAAIIYMAFIAFMSLKPYAHTAPPSTLKEFVHNSFHVPAYAIMALLLYLTIVAYRTKDGKSTVSGVKKPSRGLWTMDYGLWSMDYGLIISFTIAFIFGFLMEILQGFSAGREPSLLDLCSNAFGAGVMVYVIAKYSSLRRSTCLPQARATEEIPKG